MEEFNESTRSFLKDELLRGLQSVYDAIDRENKHMKLHVDKRFDEFKPHPKSQRIDKDIH